MSAAGHVQDQLAYYRDLSPAERRSVDAHLAHCAGCAAVLADYRRQDAMLASIDDVRPRRAWRRPVETLPARRWLGRLGDALVAGGLAALLWMFALQAQHASQLDRSLALGTPPPPAAASGIAIPATSIQPPSPWLGALPWLGGALLLVGLLFVLSRRRRWLAWAGSGLLALLLVSFVPPFSAFPNPAGIYWRAVGGYSYDPNLPFRNSFIISGLPEALLAPQLAELLGEVGLAPLDPVQPLARYEFLRVGLHPEHNRTALITTRFIYADGSSRIYPVPLFGPAVNVAGFWLSGWREDGLQRLRSDHLALAGQPFAGEGSPIRLQPARRLDGLSPAAHRLDEANPGHWLWNSVRVQRLVWSPDGRHFLATVGVDRNERQLWRVPLDGGAPVLVAQEDVREYGWSPDGETIVYTSYDAAAAAVDSVRPYAIMAAAAGPGAATVALATGLQTPRLPGLTDGGVWFFSGSALWLAPYDGTPVVLLQGDLGGIRAGAVPRPAADREMVAFACGDELCLLANPLTNSPFDPASVSRVSIRYAEEMAWSHDDERLAVIDRNPNGLAPVRLVIVDRAGEIVLSDTIAPGEATDSPQWTHDGEAVLVQTYPLRGRRIIALHLPSAQVLDLSQEHWDAYFALSPDGRQLLLNNGRGDFWITDLVK